MQARRRRIFIRRAACEEATKYTEFFQRQNFQGRAAATKFFRRRGRKVAFGRCRILIRRGQGCRTFRSIRKNFQGRKNRAICHPRAKDLTQAVFGFFAGGETPPLRLVTYPCRGGFPCQEQDCKQLCKRIVYTFYVQSLCFWKPNGA